jgi:hypothetical protein
VNKKLFILALLGVMSNLAVTQVEKKFEQVKKEYNAQGAVVKDIIITDPADAAFFTDKTLENVVFNAAVTGDWKNVTLKGTITFQELPKGNVDEKTQKNKLATLISKDAKTIKIDKVGGVYRFIR